MRFDGGGGQAATAFKFSAIDMRPSAIPSLVAVSLLGSLALAGSAAAQDMEPKAYSASPVGANFLVATYGRSTGSVVFDPSLPITDVNARVGNVALGVGHTFGLFGKLTRVSVAFPYAWGRVTGKVGGEAGEVSREGLADTRVRLSMNLRGTPAMSTAAFAKAPHRTIVGAGITVAAPTGQYYDTKLINLGTNRWGFRPEVGISVPVGRWDLDSYVGVWWFTSNASFYPGGLSRTQDPVVSWQGHAAYTFRSRAWVAADATWYRGGASQIEGGEPKAAMNNSRLGATVSLPVGTRQSIKISYSSGIVVRTGTNFNTLGVAWQMLWLSPLRK